MRMELQSNPSQISLRPGFASGFSNMRPASARTFPARAQLEASSSTILPSNHALPSHYHASPEQHDDAGLYRFCGDGRASTRPCTRPCTRRNRHAARLTDIG